MLRVCQAKEKSQEKAKKPPLDTITQVCATTVRTAVAALARRDAKSALVQRFEAAWQQSEMPCLCAQQVATSSHQSYQSLPIATN
jgi:hypothetical protein